MQKPTIEITIKRGRATVHTTGVAGESCTALTAALTRRLFGPDASPEVQLTGEYFGDMGNTARTATAEQQASS